ncbi:MAG TPA: hypothetical protein VLV16_14640 [Gemmatimonadales bacterium]|nr:hypothetical protein [Gemmatimonadales bacterium]
MTVPGLGWARSKGDRAERDGLRRGGWYRVVEDKGQAWVVLDVHHVEIRVPKDDVEMRQERPAAWSVVHAPYLVCPGCHARRFVSGQVKDHKCPDCGNSYKVDWADRA